MKARIVYTEPSYRANQCISPKSSKAFSSPWYLVTFNDPYMQLFTILIILTRTCSSFCLNTLYTSQLEHHGVINASLHKNLKSR